MDNSPHKPSLPLSVIGRLRVALIRRLIDQGFEIVEEHPDHVVAQMGSEQHAIYLSNLARAVELSIKTGGPGILGPGGESPTGPDRAGEPQPGRKDPPEESGDAPDPLLAAVDAWLAVHLRQLRSRQRFDQTYGTMEAARPVLLPRVVAPSGIGDPGRRWGRTLCDGQLDLAIVIDQPDAVAFATPEMVAGWGAASAETAAMDNLRARVSPEDFHPLPDAGELRMCASPDSYAASRILLAEEMLAAPGDGPSYGLLAALPSRDLMFCEPIGPRTVQDIVYLALLASKSADELPYPLSREVFWIRGGQWVHIPIRLSDGRMDIDSPPEFAAILQRLMDDDAPADPDR